MEIIPAEPVEEQLDGTTKEFIRLCMGTPTVLRKILEQFSNRELLTLSLVNKHWRFEARSVLKARGDLTAKIPSPEHHKSLVAFAMDLKGMRVVPFSGINVELCHFREKACQSSFNGSLDPSYNEILDRLSWTHLAVDFSEPLDTCKDCQALKLVQKILKDFQEALQELSLTLHFFCKVERELYQQVFADCTFPRLKTVKIFASSKEESLTKFLKVLVSHAPNLRSLKMNECSLLQDNVLEGSSAVLVPAWEFKPMSQRTCPSLISYLRAETILLSLATNVDRSAEWLTQVVPMVLKASHKSLKTLRMEYMFVVYLVHYGIVLENVTKLEIWMPSDLVESTQRHMSTILTSFQFTCVFPKLQHVVIVSQCRQAFTAERINDVFDHGIVRLMNISPDQTVKIKHLSLRKTIWDSELPFWAQTFPHVETLSVDIGIRLSQLPFTLLCEKFANVGDLILENIHWCSKMTANLDSAFCGIFPEEVAQLMEKDDEYLKAVNIVPVMPSITCMKGLRTLKLDFKLRYKFNGHLEMKPYPTFLFSRVTAWIGFARCPALTVTSSKRQEKCPYFSYGCVIGHVI